MLGTKGVQTSFDVLEEIPGMSLHTDTKDIAAVERAVQSIYLAAFPEAAGQFVPIVFSWAHDCFVGRHPGYQAIDARYHDLEHTLQGTLCMSRILGGRHQTDSLPRCTRLEFELGLLAILLHDTGYLKRVGDNEGTGAKYTLTHVRRSMDFAAHLLGMHDFTPYEIKAVQNMISCTGVNVDLASVPFQNDLERTVGFALGTGDLLGQMAAGDYVAKLPVLYEEFAEAQRFNVSQSANRIAFTSADDLIRKTPVFWEKYVKPKIERDFQSLHRYLAVPYPHGPNYYIDRIEANLGQIVGALATGGC